MEENTDLNIAVGCLSLGSAFLSSGPFFKSPYKFYFYGISILFYIVYFTALIIASNREKGTYISIAEIGNIIGILFSMIGVFFLSSPYSFFFLIPSVFFSINIGRSFWVETVSSNINNLVERG